MIDRKDLEAYRKDGFAVVRRAVPVADITALHAGIRDVFRPQLRRYGMAGAEDGRDAFEAALFELFREAPTSYLAAAKATQLLPALHAIGAAGPVLDLVRAFGIAHPLIAVRPVVHIIADALRVEGGYHRTPPHQDWRSVQGSLDALVVWLPLVPVDAGFGALEIAPGSHRRGLLPTRKDPFGNVVAEGEVADADFVPVEVSPGDAVVFSMFTVHRTGREQRPGVRWAVSLRYNNAAAPDFVAHDYPNPFVYRAQDDLLFDGFPQAAEVREVFAAHDD